MSDYEKLCDFQNLYKAHTVARKGKRGKREVIQFEMRLSENLARMTRDLKAKTYRMKGYYHFTIYEPKQREIFAAFYPDRVLLHCLCDEILIPLIYPRLIYDNAACQKGKGPHFAIRRFTGFLQEHYKLYGNEGYVLKCDIKKYFPSIDHEVLKRKIGKIVRDDDVRSLLFQYIDSYETEGRPGKGLPLGNQSSQLFAVYYLDPMDRLVKEKLRVKHYTRYMDDGVLLHPDKAFLQHCLQEIRNVVETELKLELNERTQIFNLKDGIEYLGWRFYLTDTGKVIRKLKPQSKLRFKRDIRQKEKEYAEGKIDYEHVRASVAARKGHLKHGHTYRLRKSVFGSFVIQRETGSQEQS